MDLSQLYKKHQNKSSSWKMPKDYLQQHMVCYQLLEEDSSTYIYWKFWGSCCRNVKGLALKIFIDLFPVNEQNNYSLKHKSFFNIPRKKAIHNVIESISNLGPKIWEILTQEIRNVNRFLNLKSKLNY